MIGSNKNNLPPELASASQEDVYVMPEKFHTHKAQQSSNKTLVTVIIILGLIVVSAGTYFSYNLWQKNQKLATEAPNQNITLVDQNVNQNENSNETRNVNVNENLNTNDNSNSNENLNTNTNLTRTIDELVPPVLSGDADRDGLTDLEESLIGTSASSPDTDLDGYLDGVEVINSYNPTVSTVSGKPSRLDTATFISTLATDFPQNNFKTYYIKGWSVSLVEALHQARIITGTGEMIKVSIIENVDQLSAANWYLVNHPQITLSQLSTVEFGNFSGIRSLNGLAVYLTDQKKEKVYAFEYDLDNSLEFRYPTMFEMIIRNFKLASGPVGATVNSNANINNSVNTNTNNDTGDNNLTDVPSVF